MKKFLILPLLFGSLYGCDQSVEREITAVNLQQQFQEIQNLINSEECTANPQCSFIAYGSKPCGGPKGYFVFSTNVDVETLKKKVKRYNEEDRIYNHQEGVASDCMYVTPPNEVGCIDGKCVEIKN